MIRAGSYDRVVRFERDSGTTEDSLGTPIKVWTKLRTAFARVAPLSGVETLKSGRELASRVSVFTVHYFADLSAKDRIRFDGRYWDIIGIKEVGRRELLEITAQTAE